MKEIIIVLIIVFLLFSGCTGTPGTNEPGVSGENDTIPEMTAELCDPRYSGYTQPVPADTSVPVKEPLSGLKYSFDINDTGRTVTMNRGDTFEITLVYVPTLIYRWTLVVEPGGLLLLNAGEFSDADPDAEDYRMQVTKGPWNYRWRYLAENEGTYFFDGILAIDPCDSTRSWKEFNLTVAVV